MFFELWFLSSVAVLSVGLGWSSSNMLFAGTTIIIFLALGATEKRSRKFILLTALLCLMAGKVIASNYRGVLNRWMEGSLSQVTNLFAENNEPDYSFGIEDFHDLKIYDTFSKKKILVFFNAFGPILLYQNKAKQLIESPGQLNAMHITNNAFYTTFSGKTVGPMRKYTFDSESATKVIEEDDDHIVHHWGDIFQGSLYLPGRSFEDQPNRITRRFPGKYGECKNEDAWLETVNVYNADNLEFIEKFDILSVLSKNKDFVSVFAEKIYNCQDPLHLNDIFVLKNNKQAEKFPNGEVGDMLISLRNISGLALLSKDGNSIKWLLSGEGGRFKRQHSPRMTQNNTLILFDNVGSNYKHGRSRIVEIDIPTKEVIGFYESDSDEYFHSQIKGKIDQIDKNTYLVQQQVQLDEVPQFSDVALFILNCPTSGISMDCQRKNIFKGPGIKFEFSNAIILE